MKKGEEPIYNLVLRDDNLNMFYFLVEDHGYAPDISHVCCRITNIRFNFNKLELIIRTRRLIKPGLDGSVCVHDEETTNTMHKATNNNYLILSIYHSIIKTMLIF